VIAAVFISLFRDTGVVDSWRLRKTERQLRARSKNFGRRNVLLKRTVEDLRSNPASSTEPAGSSHQEGENVIVVPQRQDALSATPPNPGKNVLSGTFHKYGFDPKSDPEGAVLRTHPRLRTGLTLPPFFLRRGTPGRAIRPGGAPPFFLRGGTPGVQFVRGGTPPLPPTVGGTQGVEFVREWPPPPARLRGPSVVRLPWFIPIRCAS